VAVGEPAAGSPPKKGALPTGGERDACGWRWSP